MSTNTHFQNTDKFEIHYRQQLSAMIDGELSPDESRFLLRRLEHDSELKSCQERWQLCGDVLRGQASALAPSGFADRVMAAVEDEPPVKLAAGARSGGAVRGWRRWTGGAALAASVAAVAFFMSREQVSETEGVIDMPTPVIASSARVPDVPAPSHDPDSGLGEAMAAVPAAVLAARRQEASRRAVASAQRRGQTATTTRQLAASQAQEPTRLVAEQSQVPRAVDNAPVSDQFPRVATPLHGAKPWPRSVISLGGSSAFTASLPVGEDAPGAFYPFEPRMPVIEEDAGSESATGPLQH